MAPLHPMAAAGVALLVSLLPVIDAWRHCEFSETKWFAYDELPGKSTPYALAAMNGKAYAGGYMFGSLGLFGNTKDGVVPPDQAQFGDVQSPIKVCCAEPACHACSLILGSTCVRASAVTLYHRDGRRDRQDGTGVVHGRSR